MRLAQDKDVVRTFTPDRSDQHVRQSHSARVRPGFRCQICEVLGQNPIGFIKKNGEPYVEAHHVMRVSKEEMGSLAVSNVMTVCANHHRQLHYGGIDVAITEKAFEFVVTETLVTIPKLVIPAQVPAAQVHQAGI